MAGKPVALALGSGGARGHGMGVIDELRNAAGALDAFADWAKTLSQSAVLRLVS